MKILMLYLTGQRDEIVDNLIAKHLRKFGHEVHVHPFMDAGRESVPYMKPDVVVHPFPGGQYKIDFLKKCKEWGCKIIIRRGEAGASRTVFDSLTPSEQTIMLGNWDYSPYVDLELVWGKEFGEIVAEKGHVTTDKIVACGAFSFDIYFDPDNQRTRNRKKMVLFATGFSAADCIVDYCECGLPKDAEYHRKQAEKHSEGRSRWISKIFEWYNMFKDSWDFSLKVRPGERVTEYVKIFTTTKIKVYPQTYSAHLALRDTDMLIHCGSTMAMEAHLLKIPSFNFRNINPDKILANLSPGSSDGRVIVEAFRTIDVESTNVNWNIFYELKNHLYGNIDGNACQRAAHAIQEYIHQTGEIRTDIPDTWPLEPLYLTDDVMIEEPDEELPKWLCPACKGRWWTEHKILMADCPWCGMAVQRTKPGVPEKSVLG